jgi:predicted transcriptional regulator
MSEITLYATDRKGFFADVRSLAAALDHGGRTPAEPRIAFEGTETLLKVLTPNRWQLLRRLRSSGPGSIRALAAGLGRDYRGVHADVMALLDLGLIDRDGAGKICVPWSRITAELRLEDAA